METKKNIEFYKKTIGAFEFTLPRRYIAKDLIGFGSFGAVAEAFDEKEKRSVAIKKIQNLVDAVDLKKVIREIIILKNLKHDNIITLYDVIFIRK
jgi:serine/threonine protein kinase